MRTGVAVVGLGAMGAAALWQLARRGVRAIGLDRFAGPHDKGASHGESRAIRRAYTEHPAYVPLVDAAYREWRALERAAGVQVLHITGVLEAGPAGSAMVAGVRRAAAEHALTLEELGAAGANRRFPAFVLPADYEAVFQPDGGFLEPERAIAAMLAQARAAGAEIRAPCGVTGIEPGGSSVRVRTEDGIVEADAVILAAGAWIGDLMPALGRHLTLTRQTLHWFRPMRPAQTRRGPFPVFLIETADDVVYGFPDFAGTGVRRMRRTARRLSRFWNASCPAPRGRRRARRSAPIRTRRTAISSSRHGQRTGA
jgi:sarcosine oxidase